MKTIAIIEDDEILRKVIVQTLIDQGYKVVHAPDGVAGYELIDEERPDLVLCDIVMPKKDGKTLLKELKANPDLAQIPVIMLTVSASEEDAGATIAMGAEKYIIKTQHAVQEIADMVKNLLS